MFNDSKVYDYLEYGISRPLVDNDLSHLILTELNQEQIQHYNTFDRWQQLDLMQLYLNKIRQALVLVVPVRANDYGTSPFIENFAIENRPGGIDNLSAFTPNFLNIVMQTFWAQYGQQQGTGAAHAYYNNRYNTELAEVMNSVNTDEMLAETAITGLGDRNNDFLDDRPELRQQVLEYFIANESSQYSQDGINWLLNQYQDNNVFPVNADLFKSNSTPLFQDTNNPNRVIEIDFIQQAIDEGITNFGNVLAELLKDNVNIEFEGSLIKTIFEINGTNSSNLENSWFGHYFHFVETNGESIRIENTEVTNPFLGVDCASFEYAMPPGQFKRACAVKNFNHKFYSFGMSPSGSLDEREIESYVDTIYFTMPAWKTNGMSANHTAVAVTTAIRATDIYYATHFNATASEVGDFFYDSITTALAIYGGTVTAPFFINSPAPYLRTLFNAKTDCN